MIQKHREMGPWQGPLSLCVLFVVGLAESHQPQEVAETDAMIICGPEELQSLLGAHSERGKQCLAIRLPGSWHGLNRATIKGYPFPQGPTPDGATAPMVV